MDFKKVILPGILIGGGIAIFVYMNRAKQFAKNLAIQLKGIALDFNKTKQSLFLTTWTNINIAVNNPTKFQTKITSLNLVISYNGREVGKINKIGDLIVNPESSNNLTIPVGIDTLSLFSNVASAIQAISSKLPINLNISGVINSTAGNYSINQIVKVV